MAYADNDPVIHAHALLTGTGTATGTIILAEPGAARGTASGR